MEYDPYRPPAMPPQLPPASAGANGERPASVTVFSILHLVFSAFGVFAVIGILIQPLMMKSLGSINSQTHAQMELQASYQWWMYLSAVFTAILTGLIITGGVKMLKGRSSGLSWSNAYAWSSIAFKIVGMGVTITIIGPIMRAAPQNSSMPMAFLTSSLYYALCGLTSMIYPFLSLLLLNRPQVKAWFAAQEAARA